MPNDTDLRQAIDSALRSFSQRPLDDASRGLLATLGYRSNRTIEGLSTQPEEFLAAIDSANELDQGNRGKHALLEDWQEACFLFQLTDEEINSSVTQQQMLFRTENLDQSIIQSYLFLAVRLSGSDYSRTRLATATREINRLFAQPVMVLFRYGDCLTVSIIARRRHKRDASRDVLEKVTLIKDISVAAPHRGHIDILHDLALETLASTHPLTGWADLQRAWEKTLDASILNSRFYREVANWFFWARDRVRFPTGAGDDEEERNSVSLIRLITRLIFVWFLKEKGLVPDDLFREDRLSNILTDLDPAGSTYYKAILQNLFFATLNQEMGKRGWRGEGRQHYNITTLYRYKRFFRDPDEGLRLFADIPFLNGGLFECLDKPDDAHDGKVVRVDGFSDRDDNEVSVPTDLFFGSPRTVDLNKVFGSSGKRYDARGLIRILDRFKFTVEENTPIEQEVALDPELLGQVFENLLAAYNPETGTTARKQSGSFYTPRNVVEYMVDEGLIAYLSEQLPDLPDAEARLRDLLSLERLGHDLSDEECGRLVRAIDGLRALDPACGSGAFPMGLLHKLVHLLRRLDPDNVHWRHVQHERATQAAGDAFAIADQEARQARLLEIDEAFQNNLEDYGRKLYLIENCIYGVDIQPIAVQIAKLRFFIALVVDQRVDDSRPNRGILPLPNLETRFVAANTLLAVQQPGELDLRRDEVDALERALHRARERHFAARTPETKRKYRERDRELRQKLANILQKAGFVEESARLLAKWDPYDQNANAPFFDPEWMFGICEGFDLVIGNPPYVRAEKIKELKPALARQYQCYSGTADLYVYFYERALRLLREGGVLVYISSNKYFRSGYGEALRAHLAAQRIVSLIDFGDAPVFAAIAYPSIITLRKGPGREGETLQALTWPQDRPIAGFAETLRSERFIMRRDTLSRDGWRLQSNDVLHLLDKMQGSGKRLGEVAQGRVFYGIKSGLNAAYVVDLTTRDALIAEDPSSFDLLKPMLRGRDVKRWHVKHAGIYLIQIPSSENVRHTWTGLTQKQAEREFARRYPAIYRHLEPYRDALCQRADQGRYPWELRSCAYWDAFGEPKIMYPDIAPSPQFAYDPQGLYVVDTTLFILPGAPIWMLGLLNSRAVFWAYRHLSATIRGGFLRFKTQYVHQIVLPSGGPDSRLPELVDAILESSGTCNPTSLEAEIDQEVYRLYKLTDAEIAIIEESTE